MGVRIPEATCVVHSHPHHLLNTHTPTHRLVTSIILEMKTSHTAHAPRLVKQTSEVPSLRSSVQIQHTHYQLADNILPVDQRVTVTAPVASLAQPNLNQYTF